jgi:phenylalanyl-tRNA synthetase beta chain
MQISLKWIQELLNIETVKLDNLVDKLTFAGFEVEEIKELKIKEEKQTILDVSATANRSDSLSVQGLSTEMAIILNNAIKISPYSKRITNWLSLINKFPDPISADKNCSIFISIILENLTTTNIPNWVTKKLLSSGVSPLNNLLDFQNYILLETGYPFAFYDFNKICSKLNSSQFNLEISKGEMNQEFFASNKIEYQLDDSILLIKANSIPIGISGMIENQEFSYSENTTSLLVEASIFNAAKIRQQSRTLGLRTNRSAQYEKSLKDTSLIDSLYRLISLLRISNPNLHCKLHTVSKKEKQSSKPVLLRYEIINEILGPTKESIIEPFTIQDYLERLNFSFFYDKSKLVWEVQIPYSRTDDLTREIDLIEEIGRLHGFNNFLTNLPKIKNIGNEDISYKTRKKVTSCLLGLGFKELIHYSLANQTTFINNEIRLINPLLSDCSNLRLSLLPNLVKTVKENLKQGNLFIEGFEYGHVFSIDKSQNFFEKEHLAGIFGGLKTKLNWSDAKTALTWFEAKGKIEQLLNQLNLLTYWQSCSKDFLFNILHPYRSSEIYFQNNVYLGIFGQINPLLANQFNISSEIYLFEFDFEAIQNQLQINNLTVYQEYSTYPKIVKDLSFIVQKDIPFQKIKDILYWNSTEFLTEITLLDEYVGQSIPKDHISLCFQLIFQSRYRTLQNKEIEKIINKLHLMLKDHFNAIIRD